eukprot:s5449_g12.t1
MAPKLLSLARDLFLQELDDLPRGQDLKRKARDEGGNEATVKRRYSNLKLAEWFASPESEQQIFVDRAKARVDSSQPTLKEFLGSQSESSSGPGAHLELDQLCGPMTASQSLMILTYKIAVTFLMIFQVAYNRFVFELTLMMLRVLFSS